MELVTLKDCLLPKTFELWETFNHQTRANLLKEILDKDKNLEVWVSFEYFYLRYLPIKPTDKTYCKAEELLISNKGRVMFAFYKGRRYFQTYIIHTETYLLYLFI